MHKAKILVVDDEIHILHVISLKFRNAGYEVVTARDGKEALELAQLELPDLIITDYQMPYLSGLELCRRLKQLEATRHIPVVMLTARGFMLDDNEMKEIGVKASVSKPFGPRELVQIVEDILVSAET